MMDYGGIGVMLSQALTVKMWLMIGHLQLAGMVGCRSPFCVNLGQISLGCPYGHSVHNKTEDDSWDILTDNCDNGSDNEWLVPEGTNNTDAEAIIRLGCLKRPKGFQMKNIRRDLGGTKDFIISLSDSPEGPWTSILANKFSEYEGSGCAPMEEFEIK